MTSAESGNDTEKEREGRGAKCWWDRGCENRPTATPSREAAMKLKKLTTAL